MVISALELGLGVLFTWQESNINFVVKRGLLHTQGRITQRRMRRGDGVVRGFR